jgi:hypothetical protein
MSDEAVTISVPVKGQSEPLLFASLDELEQWRRQELAFWEWLRVLSGKDGNIQKLFTDISQAFSTVDSLIREYRSAEDKRKKGVLSSIQQRLSEIFATPVTVLSTSPGAQFVNRVKAESPYVAAYVLWGLIHKDPFQNNLSNTHAIKGITLATLFQHGVASDGVEAHQAALNLASEQWRDFQTKAEAKQRTDEEAIGKLLDDTQAWRTHQEVEHEAMGKQAQAKFDQIAKSGEENFTRIQKTYNEQLGLQAPVLYWEDRAARYLKSAIIFAIAAGVVGIASAILIWLEVQALVIPFSNYSEPTQFGVHAWRYAFVIASAAFLVWPIRILVRILLSSIHLRIDAQERATLAKTYLAFVRSNEGLDEKDRQLILEVLFRPSSTGIIKDDAAPGSFIQLLSRLGSGDKR